jgi:hypothetical protein
MECVDGPLQAGEAEIMRSNAPAWQRAEEDTVGPREGIPVFVLLLIFWFVWIWIAKSDKT